LFSATLSGVKTSGNLITQESCAYFRQPPLELFLPPPRSVEVRGNSMNRMITIHSLKAFGVSTLVRLAFGLLLSSIAFSQGGVATGDLHVTVKDPKGSLVVTNATVKVSDVAKGLERTATGDGQGGYSVRLLASGRLYTVTVEAAGFGKAEAKDVSITVGGWWSFQSRSRSPPAERWWRSALAGGIGGDLAHLDHGHDWTAPHRQSSQSTAATTLTSR
jgi:hypothetical protein